MNDPIIPFYWRHGLHVEVYDAQTEAGFRHNDVGFYRELAVSAGGPVLELGCGTGRVAIPLLDTGLEIHGLDASDAMLDVARQKRAQLPEESARRLHLHQGDMARFDLNRKFAFIYIAFRSFQILTTPEEQQACLRCVRGHLAPGGTAVINLFDPRYEMLPLGNSEHLFPPREFAHPVSGNRILVETVERVNEPVSQTLRELWRFTEFAPGGEVLRREEESLHLRWTFRHEMRYLVERCGLTVEAEYSDFHRSPPAYAKEQVWVLKAA